MNTLDDTLQMITPSSSNKDRLDSGEDILQHVLFGLVKKDLHQVTLRCAESSLNPDGGLHTPDQWVAKNSGFHAFIVGIFCFYLFGGQVLENEW